ncbi:hypothetical protein [Actinophytocola gossypii]|uniref:Uncharacterized protein n=1 Tax=Actinophytocola gossypii TaxID=2812003 RepID=A0ABT2J755_9PSEU|nr:hypothetical protein [Actinophytocola gossypii]MCT2583680.1 hypothetical protein [Actinophytocola gossypii]
MPRLGYETPCRPVPRPTERDRFLVVVKLATFAFAVAVLGAFALLSGTTREAGSPSAAVTPTTTPSRPAVIAPPVASTMTSEIVPTPPPAPATTTTTTTRTTPPPAPPPPASTPPRDPRFAVVGEPCPRAGTYSLTARYRPVVCRDGAWRLIPLGR